MYVVHTEREHTLVLHETCLKHFRDYKTHFSSKYIVSLFTLVQNVKKRWNILIEDYLNLKNSLVNHDYNLFILKKTRNKYQYKL